MYLGFNIKLVKLYRDNQGLLNLVKNPEFYQRTKYINVKHHFIQEYIITEVINL
jgi:hypothetical protein